MLFSGIHTLTLLDFPVKIAAIVFTPGCNFRCHFCHNPEFVLPEEISKLASGFIKEEKISHFLEKRKGKLDGLVISGGEPTLHDNLPEFIQKVKKKGFLIKLDTNGTNPKMINLLIQKKLVDYIAMDIKTTPENYEKLIAVQTNLKKIEETKNILEESKIEYEFRTTVIKKIHTHEDIKKIAEWTPKSKKHTLQNFRKENLLNKSWGKYESFSKEEMEEMKKILESFGKIVTLLNEK